MTAPEPWVCPKCGGNNPNVHCNTIINSRFGAPDGWQPIETAPDDGEWFLACENGEIYPCEWLTERGRGGWYDLFNQSFENPTHWMPLPPAPVTA